MNRYQFSVRELSVVDRWTVVEDIGSAAVQTLYTRCTNPIQTVQTLYILCTNSLIRHITVMQ